SCCEHCDWVLLGALVGRSEGPPEGRIFLLPRTDYERVDTWRVSGLQATGSWDVIVDDAFVPAYRSQSMLDNFLLKGPGQALNTASPFRVPFWTDLRARHFDRRARRVAGHAQRAPRLQQNPGDAGGRAIGGKSLRSAAVCRDGSGRRRDDDHS